MEPRTVDEAVQLLTAAWTRGARTAVDESRPLNTAAEEGHVVAVSLRRLDRITRVDRENSAVVVEAGVPVQAIRAATDSIGLWCPALRWLPGSTPIGAAVVGGHGRRSRRYGAVADYLLGTRFVSPAVGLVRHGGMAIKNATGYNLTAAIAGSRGGLGVLLEVTVRLVPKPARRGVRRICFATENVVWGAARGLADPSSEAAAVEVFAELTPTRGPAYLLVEAEDVVATTVERRLGSLVDRATSPGGSLDTSIDWLPLTPDGAATVVRFGVDPSTLAETGTRLVAEARRRDLRGFVLAEASGGAVEIALSSSCASQIDEVLRAAGIPAPDPTTTRLRAILKSAFDPADLVI